MCKIPGINSAEQGFEIAHFLENRELPPIARRALKSRRRPRRHPCSGACLVYMVARQPFPGESPSCLRSAPTASTLNTRASGATAIRPCCSSWASPRQLVGWPDSLCNGLAGKGFRVIRFDNRDIGKSTHLAQLGAPDLPAMIAAREAGEWPAAPYSARRHGRRRRGPPRCARNRPRPCRRRLDGRHDRATGRDQSPGEDEKPRLDHVDHRTARPAARQARGLRRDHDPAGESRPRRPDRARGRGHARDRQPGLSRERSGAARNGRARRRPHPLRSCRECAPDGGRRWRRGRATTG